MPELPASDAAARFLPTAGEPMRWVAFASLVALIAIGVAWESWLAPTGRGTLVVKVLPLVLALPGVWLRRLYTFRWLSLVVWMYFVEGVVRAWGDRGTSAALAGAEIALSVVLFAACAAHIRQRLAAAKVAA